jgi:hypothetical protein
MLSIPQLAPWKYLEVNLKGDDMAVYADYTFYTTDYLGTAISSANFARLALRASAVIDQLTFNRAAAVILADEDAETVLAIQNATCAVAEEYQTIENSGGIGIKSESIGSNSVTYVEGSKQTQTQERRLSNSAKTYLGLTGLMYRGLLEDE